MTNDECGRRDSRMLSSEASGDGEGSLVSTGLQAGDDTRTLRSKPFQRLILHCV